MLEVAAGAGSAAAPSPPVSSPSPSSGAQPTPSSPATSGSGIPAGSILDKYQDTPKPELPGGQLPGATNAEPAASATAETVDLPLDDEPQTEGQTPAIEFAKHKEYLKLHPELRVQLNELNGYRELFGTKANAKAIREMVSSADDVRLLQENAEVLDTVNSLLDSPDPEDHGAILEGIERENPARLANLEQAILNRLAKNSASPETARKIPPAIRSQAFTDVMTNLVTAADRAGNADLSAAIRMAYEAAFANGAPGGARQPGQDDSPVARENAMLKRQLQEFQGRNGESFRTSLNSTIGTQLSSSIETAIPKTDGTPDGVRARMLAEVRQELVKAIRADRVFDMRLKSINRDGNFDQNHHKAVSDIYKLYGDRYLPSIAKRVMDSWTRDVLSASPRRAASAPMTEPGAGSPTIPANGKIEWEKGEDFGHFLERKLVATSAR